MKLQYRIACVGKDYYPHVRIKKLLFWGKWKRVVDFTESFRLSKELTSSGDSRPKCKDIIARFDLWFKKQNEEVYYEPYDPNPKVNYTW